MHKKGMKKEFNIKRLIFQYLKKIKSSMEKTFKNDNESP